MRVLSYLLGAAAILLPGLILLTANRQSVSVTWFFGQTVDISLWLALSVAFGAGGFLVRVGLILYIVKFRFNESLLSRKVSKLEAELKALKQKPLPDEQKVFPLSLGPALKLASHKEQNQKALTN